MACAQYSSSQLSVFEVLLIIYLLCVPASTKIVAEFCTISQAGLEDIHMYCVMFSCKVYRHLQRIVLHMGARRHGQGGAHAPPPGKFQKMYSKIC